MMSDFFEQLDDSDLEEDADEEVDKVLFEITEGQLGKAVSAPSKQISRSKQDTITEDAELEKKMAALLNMWSQNLVSHTYEIAVFKHSITKNKN